MSKDIQYPNKERTVYPKISSYSIEASFAHNCFNTSIYLVGHKNIAPKALLKNLVKIV